MAPAQKAKQGKKRTRSGKEKPQESGESSAARKQTQPTTTPPQSRKPVDSLGTPSNKLTSSESTQNGSRISNIRQESQMPPPPRPITAQPIPTTTQKTKKKIQKLPPLPANTSLTPRRLHRPAIPSPFSSASSPKTVYITATTPFISAIKRIRGLLSEIKKREEQSTAAVLGRPRNAYGGRGKGRISTVRAGAGPRDARGRARPMPLVADGTLTERDVEAAIADSTASGARTAVGKERECVYVKATGRAIPRALEVGVYFQGQSDCGVRVRMGNVKAIDDIEVLPEDGEDKDGTGDVDMRDVAGDENGSVEDGQEDAGRREKGQGEKTKKPQQADIPPDEVPETRIRTLSTITVSIWSV